MSATRPGSGTEDPDAGTWASETLPMSVRKELLERELSKLGFRKSGAQGATSSHDAGGAQQKADGGSSHPQADAHDACDHGD